MTLPELHGNEILCHPTGRRYTVRRVRKPRRDAFDEPIFKLQDRTTMLTLRSEYTLEELGAAKLEVV
jgi:hypothetical protein